MNKEDKYLSEIIQNNETINQLKEINYIHGLSDQMVTFGDLLKYKAEILRQELGNVEFDFLMLYLHNHGLDIKDSHKYITANKSLQLDGFYKIWLNYKLRYCIYAHGDYYDFDGLRIFETIRPETFFLQMFDNYEAGKLLVYEKLNLVVITCSNDFVTTVIAENRQTLVELLDRAGLIHNQCGRISNKQCIEDTITLTDNLY